MSVDTERERTADRTDVEAMGRQLGEAIADLPEYEQYEEARVAVEDSEEAQERIESFERMRQEFVIARQSGDATQEDLDALQDAQRELHGMPVMEAYLAAQSDLLDRLKVVNEAISDPVSLDFGEEAGGCCHD